MVLGSDFHMSAVCQMLLKVSQDGQFVDPRVKPRTGKKTSDEESKTRKMGEYLLLNYCSTFLILWFHFTPENCFSFWICASHYKLFSCQYSTSCCGNVYSCYWPNLKFVFLFFYFSCRREEEDVRNWRDLNATRSIYKNSALMGSFIVL